MPLDHAIAERRTANFEGINLCGKAVYVDNHLIAVTPSITLACAVATSLRPPPTAETIDRPVGPTFVPCRPAPSTAEQRMHPASQCGLPRQENADVIRRVVCHCEVYPPIAIKVAGRQAVRTPFDLDPLKQR